MPERDRESSPDKALQEQQESERADAPRAGLSQPARDPDPTEWPDPYDRRPDPLDPLPDEDGVLRPAGQDGQSTSSPHPREDPEAIPAEGPKHDRKRVDR